MKIILLALALSTSCTRITTQDWYFCEEICSRQTVEACRSVIKGLGCACAGGLTIWTDKPPDSHGYETSYE